MKLSMNINIAYYRKEDWDRFLDSIDDRSSMHDTWEEWHEAFLKTKAGLVSQGFVIKDFVVDIDKLKRYCIKKRIKNDGKARSRFVSNR